MLTAAGAVNSPQGALATFQYGVVAGDVSELARLYMIECAARTLSYPPEMLLQVIDRQQSFVKTLKNEYEDAIGKMVMRQASAALKDLNITLFKAGWSCGSRLSAADPDARADATAHLTAIYMSIAQDDSKEKGKPFDQAKAYAQARSCGSTVRQQMQTFSK